MTLSGLVRASSTIVLAVVIPWLVVSAGSEGTRGSVWIICVMIAVWSGWRLSGLITAALPRLYEFMFWLFCYIFMGIAPATQLRTDEMPSTTPFVLARGDLAAASIVVVGIVGFELGCLLERTRRGRRALGVQSTPDHDAASSLRSERTPTFSRLFPLMALTALCAAYYIKSAGLSAFFSNRDLRDRLIGRAISDSTLAAIMGTLSWVPALVVIHRIVNATRNTDGTRNPLRTSDRLLLALAAVLILIVNNPISSARYVFGAMALSLTVLFGAFRNRRRTRWTMVALLAALFVVFPVADLFRRESSAPLTLSFDKEYRGNGDYDAFAQIHNAVTVTNGRGFTFVQQPLGIALFWVPRSVWTGKPQDTGIYLAEARGYSFTNLSAPLWSELYLIGGVASVFGGFVLVGYWIRRADAELVRLFEEHRPFSVVGAYIPFYLMILLRGSLLQATALVAVFLGAVRFTRPTATMDEIVADSAQLAPTSRR